MSRRTLSIRANRITSDQHAALIKALRTAGLRRDQLTVVEETSPVSGPSAWIAGVCFIGAVMMLSAWIWTGTWQWGPTAALTLLVGMASFAVSVSKIES